MTMITEDYVSFETAKLLKEKGFNNDYPKLDCTQHVPTLQMVMKWLREIHGYAIVVEPGLSEDKYVWTYKVIFYRTRTMLLQHEDNVGSSTYEKVCEAAIRYCLENLI